LGKDIFISYFVAMLFSSCAAICNSRNYHRICLHDEKVGVLCVISACRIIGPIFSNDTVNGALSGTLSAS
jgi:hypothetical protein